MSDEQKATENKAEKAKNKMAEKEKELMELYGQDGTFVSADGTIKANDCPVQPNSYTHVDPDTIDTDAPDEATADEWRKIVTKTPKRLVQRKCAKTGNMFWVATSDLHQCFFDREARDEVRKERQKASRANKRDAEKKELQQLRDERDALQAEKDGDDAETEDEDEAQTA
jgi:hypothetical protein